MRATGADAGAPFAQLRLCTLSASMPLLLSCISRQVLLHLPCRAFVESFGLEFFPLGGDPQVVQTVGLCIPHATLSHAWNACCRCQPSALQLRAAGPEQIEEAYRIVCAARAIIPSSCRC